jgi:molybdate transport system substrate-binding protein
MRKLTAILGALFMAAAPLAGAPQAMAGDAPAPAEVTVFAAASLTNAMQEIGKNYEAAKGGKVKFSFAASSALARQIEAGAPAQIYASANVKWMNYVADKGLIEKGTRKTPIGNKLVLIAPADSKLNKVEIGKGFDLAKLLGADGRLSVGDPDHVPAGIYAKEALQKTGAWKAVEPRLARADSVRAALVLVEKGEAPLGVVYETDAKVSSKVKIVGVFPGDSHKPIVYPFAIVKGQDNAASRAFFDYVTGEPGLAVFVKYGFSRN